MTIHRMELHVHSVLSPCASLEMIPPFIIEKALQTNIDIIALTDHNTAANVPAMAGSEGQGSHEEVGAFGDAGCCHRSRASADPNRRSRSCGCPLRS